MLTCSHVSRKANWPGHDWRTMIQALSEARPARVPTLRAHESLIADPHSICCAVDLLTIEGRDPRTTILAMMLPDRSIRSSGRILAGGRVADVAHRQVRRGQLPQLRRYARSMPRGPNSHQGR